VQASNKFTASAAMTEQQRLDSAIRDFGRASVGVEVDGQARYLDPHCQHTTGQGKGL
jgi:hypothetical protein